MFTATGVCPSGLFLSPSAGARRRSIKLFHRFWREKRARKIRIFGFFLDAPRRSISQYPRVLGKCSWR